MTQARRAASRAIAAVCLCALSLPVLLAQQTAGGSPQAAGPPQSARLEGTAAISGTITDGTTSKPLPGVMVYLGFQGRGAVGRLSRQMTDSKGRFVFTDLPPGANYFINATRPGYLDGHFGVGAGGLLGALIVLNEDQWLRDVNIVMHRPGSITGTIFDEHGDPAVDVYVRAFTRITIGGRSQLASGQTARTDDRGVYRLADLLPGRYFVQVPFVRQTYSSALSAADLAGVTPQQAASGRPIPELPASLDLFEHARFVASGFLLPNGPAQGRPQTYPSMFFPGATSLNGAQAIDLKGGEERTGVNVSLRAVPATSISGTLQGPPEALSGGIVRLVADSGEGGDYVGDVATATVGPDGRFTFAMIPSGAYTIEMRPMTVTLEYRPNLGTRPVELPATPGRSGSSGGGGSLSMGPAGARMSYQGARERGYFAQHKVEVKDPVTDLVVPLQRTGRILGRYEMENGEPPPAGPASGVVQAESAGADFVRGFATSLPALPVPAGTAGPPAPRTTFEVSGLYGGAYYLRFLTLPGGGMVKSIIGDDGTDYTGRPIDVSTGRDVSVVVTVTTRRIELSGVVADAKGSTASQMIVLAFPAERQEWTALGLSSSRFRATPTGSDGSYRYSGLSAGSYFLVALPPEATENWQDPQRLAQLSQFATRITLNWGDKQTQALTLARVK